MISAAEFGKMMRLTFQQWFRLVRDRAGVSQKQIANELGLSVQTVGNWEGGRSNPSLDPVQTQKLCQMLGVTLNELATAFAGEMEVQAND